MRRALVLMAVLLLGPAAWAEPSPGGEEDLAGAGKVIDVGPDGSSRVVKGEAQRAEPAEQQASKDGVSLAESCRARLAAQCKALQRCLGGDGSGGDSPFGELTLPCETMSQACDQVQGEAPYTRKELDACVRGLASLRCDMQIDPTNLASLDLESRVPGCSRLLEAERAQGGGSARGGTIDIKGAQPGVDLPDLGGALTE